MAQTDDIIAGKWITTFNIVYWRHYRKRNKNHAKTLKGGGTPPAGMCWPLGGNIYCELRTWIGTSRRSLWK